MHLVSEDIEEYCIQHSNAGPEYLQALYRETHLKTLYPQMLSGPLQGRFLAWVSRMLRPRTILEVGTFTGYSALCLAEGLPPEGQLFSLEADPEFEEIAKRYWSQSPYADRMHWVLGNALETIPKLPVQNFDLIFLDADKENYPAYYTLLRDRLNPGGLWLADNVLWSGKVLNAAVQDKETQGLRRFAQRIAEDPQLETLMLPLRDGLMMARRKMTS
ncbi:MAG: O-methyltransferase [Flavobacteriales bacterium]|nr:O-methyltransferase [Flavobacteriales bacterium]